MRIVIIGAKGMLGQELAKVFQTYKPLLWDRDEIDITDQHLVDAKIGQIRPEMVINAAAYNDVDGAENNEPLAMSINGLAVGYLANAVHAYKGILVHYSTDYVFKGDNKNGYKESDVPNPQSVYARSKLAGEQAFQHSGVAGYVVRLSRLFGKPAIGERAKKSFVDTMLQLAKTRRSLNVVNEEASSPTYAPDLALRTKYIMENKLPNGIYHVTNSGSCTWYEFAKEIFAQSKNNVTIVPVSGSDFPRPAARPSHSILINTKLPPLRTWQEALQEYLHENY
ncbi:MAG: dTDP-4-dehydrorhamnose reductase [Patescibacteria group bacterium]